MIVTIHQPQYLTWLGFFNKVMNADVFVLLDSVQFQKNGFQNRTKIKAPPTWQWLTVPVTYEFPAVIKDVRISNAAGWQDKQWKSISQNYSKATHFGKYAEKLGESLKKPFENMADLIIETNKILFEALKIDIPVFRSSEMGVAGNKSDLLIAVCKKAGADKYLAGAGGREYMDEAKFADAGIEIAYQDFKHPEYGQQYRDIPFQPNMSVIDLIFNCGEKSREIVLSGYNPAGRS